MDAPPPITLAELTTLFRKLAAAIEAMPETPTRKDALFFLDQSASIGRLARAALDPPPLSATEAEFDRLHAAMSETHLLIHERFGTLLPPRGA